MLFRFPLSSRRRRRLNVTTLLCRVQFLNDRHKHGRVKKQETWKGLLIVDVVDQRANLKTSPITRELPTPGERIFNYIHTRRGKDCELCVE